MILKRSFKRMSSFYEHFPTDNIPINPVSLNDTYIINNQASRMVFTPTKATFIVLLAELFQQSLVK